MLFHLHLIALGCYGLSAALALVAFASSRPTWRSAALAVPTAGAALHIAGLVQLPLAGVAPILSLLALFLMVLQIVSERVFHAPAVALFTAPLATGLIGLALLLGLAPGAEPLSGGNLWLVFHITLSVLGLALLALAFIAAALYLLQFRELKSKRFGQVFLFFPPLERLDSLNHSALVAGFPALTAGVLLALGYAARFAGGIHVDRAQIVWGLFTWMIVGAAVWLRVVRRWDGRRAAVASIAGFAVVLVVYLAFKLSAPGAERFL
jgi:ABC-type transport system involved in cytochrome c biogenesis permease subunit